MLCFYGNYYTISINVSFCLVCFFHCHRQIAELEMQKKQNSSKLNRLKAETRNLESHVDMLHTSVSDFSDCVFYVLRHMFITLNC